MKRVSLKTEAAKGVAEYKPKKTFYPKNTVDSEPEVPYRDELLTRIKVHKALSAKKHMAEYVSFNNNLDNPSWFWNLEALDKADVQRLRTLAVILENEAELRK